MSVEILQKLVRTPSIFGEEHAAMRIVEQELERLGVTIQRVPFDTQILERHPDAQKPICAVAGRYNIIAKLDGAGGGRSIILNAHVDVVPGGDAGSWIGADPWSGAIRNGAVYGRGSYDDKAGVAIILDVIGQIRHANHSGDVIAQFVLEDETTGNGTLLCLEHGPDADAAIIIDGTRGERGINQHAGNLKFRITVRGKPASVSVSHMGTNAAEILAATVLALKRDVLALNVAAEPPFSQFPSPNQLSTISLQCDEAALTVPDNARATLYATFTPPHTLVSFCDLLQERAASAARVAGASQDPELEVLFATEPVRSEDGAIERAIAIAARRSIPFGPSTGTSDMRHFVKRGIPCVLYGPGRGYNPHRADEHFEIASLQETTDLVTAAVMQWCR